MSIYLSRVSMLEFGRNTPLQQQQQRELRVFSLAERRDKHFLKHFLAYYWVRPLLPRVG